MQWINTGVGIYIAADEYGFSFVQRAIDNLVISGLYVQMKYDNTITTGSTYQGVAIYSAFCQLSSVEVILVTLTNGLIDSITLRLVHYEL